MGCIGKIVRTFLFLILLYCFFAFGIFSYLKEKYYSYTTPKREILIQEEKDFGNLENISSNYIFSRSINFFGYRKLNIFYVPKKQKISIFDLNSNNILLLENIEENKLQEIIENFSSKFFSTSFVPINNIKVIKKGKIKAGNKTIPYVEFESDFKLMPLIKAKGTVALYETKNQNEFLKKIKNKNEYTLKCLFSMKFFGEYDYDVTKNFIEELNF